MWKIILLLQGLGELSQDWKVRSGQLLLKDGNKLHHQPDLSLIKIEDSMRSQILTGAVQGSDHSTFIFSNGSYIGIPHEVSCEFEPQYPPRSL